MIGAPPEWIGYAAIGLCAMAVVLLLSARKRRNRAGELPYFAREFLLSRGEKAFYDALVRAIGQHEAIYVKVRLADLINCTDEDWRRGFGPPISGKHIDFVLAEKRSLRVKLCIELDDRSHDRPERQARDRFVNAALEAAGVGLLRVRARATYDPEALRRRVRKMLRERAEADAA